MELIALHCALQIAEPAGFADKKKRKGKPEGGGEQNAAPPAKRPDDARGKAPGGIITNFFARVGDKIATGGTDSGLPGMTCQNNS